MCHNMYVSCLMKLGLLWVYCLTFMIVFVLIGEQIEKSYFFFLGKWLMTVKSLFSVSHHRYMSNMKQNNNKYLIIMAPFISLLVP